MSKNVNPEFILYVFLFLEKSTLDVIHNGRTELSEKLLKFWQSVSTEEIDNLLDQSSLLIVNNFSFKNFFFV